MSFDTRSNSALTKRAEQLRRWEESDTNREPSVPKNEKGRRIKFSSGCVFLAACVAGDKDEVIRLLESGADINTANVDGLTALHQACIDDNLEMVEFLVEHGADINRQDNEGWTPLHATASCGFVSIARYLVENGADLQAINSDGELAIDLASTNAMAIYLQDLYDELGIDCENARQIEEQTMLNDAKKWLKSDASEADKPHPKTGATALHVAAAKGYTKVLGLLLAGRANVDKQDNDGWTPLHAAAHWGQKETSEMLIDAMADIEIKNYAGQTPIDVAEPKIVRFLEELKANNKRAKRRPSSQIRISDTIENHIETPTKLIRVEVKSDSKESTTPTAHEEDKNNSLERITESEETDSDLTDSTESSHSTSLSDKEEKSKPPSEPVKSPPEPVEEDAPWRRNTSSRTRNQQQQQQQQQQQESPPKSQVPDKEKSTDSEVILRRTQSFENDEKFYQKYHELRARIKANSCPILPATQTSGVISAVNTPNSFSVQRSASLKDHRHNIRKPVSPPVSPSTPATTPNTGQVRSNNINDIYNNKQNSTSDQNLNRKNDNNTKTNDSGSLRSKISPGNIFKNFFKSFVPPVRDEESETQRKAHAKRVRETRRSTQGVTLDEIKSAEELVKKKNLSNNNNNNTSNNMTSSNSTSNNDSQNITPSTTAITTTTTTNSTTSTSTTTTTTLTSTDTTVTNLTTLKLNDNERVPLTIPDEIEPSEISSSSTITSTGQSITTDQSNDDEISASYTIIAPLNKFNKESSISINNDDDDDKNNKISATYTISPPPPKISSTTSVTISSSSTTTTTTEPSISDDKNVMEEANITATINVPNLNINNNNDNKKTENNVEEMIKTASPTVIITEDNLHDNNGTNNISTISLSTSPTLTEEDNKIQTQTTTTTTPTIRNSPSPISTIDIETNRVRDKRSLFDIDNAYSLTLAEKLRNEANKYNEASRSNNDITMFGINKTTTITPSSFTIINDDNNTEKDSSSLINRKCDSSPSSPLHHGTGLTAERRPSWRLKFDSGSKFKLEDVSAGTTYPPSNSTIITSAPAVIAAANLSSIAQRRSNNTANATSQTPRPVSAPVISSSAGTTDNSSSSINDRFNRDSTSTSATTTSSDVTVTLRRNKNSEDKENDKENDSRSAQATQAVIQRRRRPKRRSTGVVHLDMDDIDPDKQDSPGDNEEKEVSTYFIYLNILFSSTNLNNNNRLNCKFRIKIYI